MFARLAQSFNKAFPERVFYHRSGGQVHYIALSPWQQAIGATLLSAVMGWVVFATGSVILEQSYPVRDSYTNILEDQIEVLRSEIQLRDSEIDQLQSLSVDSISNSTNGGVKLSSEELQILSSAEDIPNKLKPILRTLVYENSQLKQATQQQEKRLQRLDIRALEQTYGTYGLLKHTIATMEPENTYSADKYLDTYFSIIRSLLFGLAAGISAVFGIIFTRFVSGFTQRKSLPAPDSSSKIELKD